jgi:hypothetical protein
LKQEFGNNNNFNAVNQKSKYMTPEQAQIQERKEIKLSRADNGYIVRAWPKTYVFTTFEQVATFLKVELDAKLDPTAFPKK